MTLTIDRSPQRPEIEPDPECACCGDGEITTTFTPHFGDEPVTVAVRYRWLGPTGAPVIVVQGGTSAGRAVAPIGAERRGWWHGCVGAGAFIDTDVYRVLGLEWLTPDDIPDVPISPHDQATAVRAVLDAHRVRKVRAHVGASYGGMVGQVFAAANPDLLEHLIIVSAAHRSHPMSTAVRLVQRRIVDLVAGHPELHDQALALARALAVTTYRSDVEFAERFTEQPSTAPVRFPVEEYLDAVGERFVRAISADRFRGLSESVDLHYIDPSDILIPTTLIGVGSDRLVPLADIRALAREIPAPCALYELNGVYGHDTFLKEPERVGAIIAEVLR